MVEGCSFGGSSVLLWAMMMLLRLLLLGDLLLLLLSVAFSRWQRKVELFIWLLVVFLPLKCEPGKIWGHGGGLEKLRRSCGKFLPFGFKELWGVVWENGGRDNFPSSLVAGAVFCCRHARILPSPRLALPLQPVKQVKYTICKASWPPTPLVSIHFGHRTWPQCRANCCCSRQSNESFALLLFSVKPKTEREISKGSWLIDILYYFWNKKTIAMKVS